MKSIKDIIVKYDGKTPSYINNAIGYLSWGGRGYYKKNSTKPIWLNSDAHGFILNNKGQVQCFSFKEDKNFSTRKWWGLTLDKYYPWPYFPDKKIKKWEVVRIMPNYFVGQTIEVFEIDANFAYANPEFYKPVY